MIKSSATDKEILSFIESWVSDLENENYEAAYNKTSHDPYYNWSPELIEKVINGYGLPDPHPNGKVYKVTSIQKAKGAGAKKEIDREASEGNIIGYAYYDLPLNGEWSDLTASFRLEKRKNTIVLILEEIHVF